MKKKLKPVEGSADDDVKEIEEALSRWRALPF